MMNKLVRGRKLDKKQSWAKKQLKLLDWIIYTIGRELSKKQ